MSVSSPQNGDSPSLSPEQMDMFVACSKQANIDHRRKLEHFVASNRRRLDATDDSTYIGAGSVRFAVFILFGVFSFEITFVGNPSGTLAFSGNSGLFGLGGWAGPGAAVFALSPDQISANGSVIVAAAGVEANAFMVTVYDNNNVQYGTITGVAAGGGVGGGSVGGTYTWSGN